jgi:hypothetical protein
MQSRNRLVLCFVFSVSMSHSLIGEITTAQSVGIAKQGPQHSTPPFRVAREGPVHSTRRAPHANAQEPNEFKVRATTCRSTGVSFSYHGGKLLEHAQIQVIFWGSQWTDAARAAARANIEKMVRSGYLTQIYPARVGCPASLSFFADTSVTPAPGASVQAAILRLIRSGKVISPTTNQDNVYLLIAPGRGYAGRAYGKHTWMQLTNGAYVHYGIVDNRSFSQMSQTFSHELVETISDPRFRGYYGNDGGHCGQQPCENADACYCFTHIQGNVPVTFYYSPGKACVAPDAPGCGSVPDTP